MKTSWFSKLNRMSFVLYGTLVFVIGITSCDRTDSKLDRQSTEPITNSKEIVNSAKLTGQILGKIHNNKEFLTLKTEAERFKYIKDMLKDQYNITTDFNYENLVNIKAQVKNMESYSSNNSKGARKGSTSQFDTDYSAGEMQFINYANSQLQNSSDLSAFNSTRSSLAAGLRTNSYPYLTYNESLRMDMYLRYYSQYVNDWPDDLSTFEPFGTYSDGTYYDPSSGARISAPLGACNGFFKKLCIAAWTSFIAAAGGSVGGPGGVIVGGAAGYLIGRCCKCGCTCDNVVCAF